MNLQPATLALFVVTAAVWVDNSAWWTKAIVTASFVVCVVIDIRRSIRNRRSDK